MKGRRYYLFGNYCERRALDVERLRNYLDGNGLRKANDVDSADVILFYACGMKEMPTLVLLEEIKGILGQHMKKAYVLGCYPAMVAPKIKHAGLEYVALSELAKMDSFLSMEKGYRSFGMPNTILSTTATELDLDKWDPRLDLPYNKDVFSVTLSEGCSEKCSYCTIRKATGVLRSQAIDAIIQQVKEGLSRGYRKIYFQCENMSSYGRDLGTDLGALLDELAMVKPNFTTFFQDLHPMALVNHFGSITAFMERNNVALIHLPVQSAANSVLKRMNRFYEIHEVEDKFGQIINRHRGIKIGTDIIAGFPTETMDEYHQSYNFMKRYGFDWIYLHAYNDKEGAASVHLTPKISYQEIEKRIKLAYDTIENIACYLNNYRGEVNTHANRCLKYSV